MTESNELSARLAPVTNDSVVEGGPGSTTPLAVALVSLPLAIPAGTAWIEVFITPAPGATVFYTTGVAAATAADGMPIPSLSREIIDVGPDAEGDPMTINFISDDAADSAVRVLIVAG